MSKTVPNVECILNAAMHRPRVLLVADCVGIFMLLLLFHYLVSCFIDNCLCFIRVSDTADFHAMLAIRLSVHSQIVAMSSGALVMNDPAVISDTFASVESKENAATDIAVQSVEALRLCGVSETVPLVSSFIIILNTRFKLFTFGSN